MIKIYKQISILLFFLGLVGILFLVFYFFFKPEMTCNDGIRNQGELDIDCGGPCAPCKKKLELDDLVVKHIERADDYQGGEDLVINVFNPNKEYGLEKFKFQIVENGNKDQNLKWYEDFILPGETKNIIINNFKAKNKNSQLELVIDNTNLKWRKIADYVTPKLVVYNKEYKLFTSGSFYSEITGLLVNKSNIDYENVKVKGILRDSNGKLIAASYHILNTLKANEQREFHIIFPTKFSQEVVKTQVEVETNIFNLDNYLKFQGKPNYTDE